MRYGLRAGLAGAALATTLAPPPATASELVVLTCSLGYPTYADPSGWTEVTGTCDATGSLHGPAVLTATTYVGPGCAAVSAAGGWFIAADWAIEVSWTRVGAAAAVNVHTPAGWGTAAFVPEDRSTVCGLHAGPANETAVYTLVPWTVPW
jgi:hypothetical protein